MDSFRPTSAPRATIADVARRAGVSVATVDRVLNRRAPVKPDTARRVLEAARDAGFHATGLLGRRIEEIRPERRLGFLLQRRADFFYRRFGAELARAARAAPGILGRPVVEHMEDLTPGRVAEQVARMRGRVEALALVAADHPRINAAIEDLAAEGLPVFTLLSDVTTPARAGFFGVDHRKSGRTAAWALARLAGAPGDLAIVVGSHRYLGHEICEMSFRSYIREHAPGFRILEPLTSLEDEHFAHEATLDLMRRTPGLAGLYVAGGGSAGVIEALRERTGPGRVAAVCNELTPVTRAALLDGIVDVVLDTPIGPLADACVAAMAARLAGGTASNEPPAPLPFDIYVAENL